MRNVSQEIVLTICFLNITLRLAGKAATAGDPGDHSVTGFTAPPDAARL
jgi:hypothetical protein